MISLTQDERDKFALYLEQDAASTEGIAKQMERLPGVMAQMAKKFQNEAVAMRIVAAKLRSIQEERL